MELKRILKEIRNADVICEVGIGLHPATRRTGYFESDKVGLGNVHLAFGGWPGYGTDYGIVDCPLHADMVMYECTISVDGRDIPYADS